MQWLAAPLGALMRICYQLTGQYGPALILFTLLTKAVLFPVSFWVHTNGIRAVRMQPMVDRIKVRFFGDKDRIAEEQALLYKKEKYSPFSGVVPVIVQLVLLIGLIQVIYHPLTHILSLPQETVQGLISMSASDSGFDPAAGSAEMLTLHSIQSAADPNLYLYVSGMSSESLASIQSLRMTFLGVDLSAVPLQAGGATLLVPVFAGLASLLLGLCQNRINPVQAAQGKAAQWTSNGISIGISLIIGFSVPAGIGCYWIFSNLFTILQQLLLNAVYPPAKHIDYAELEAARKELEELTRVGGRRSRTLIRREKEDYRRFFSVRNKHLVFYSESNGFYKYFEKILDYLLAHTNLTIHYITSDPEDQIFALSQKEERIRPYYIGEKKLITLFMRMEADTVVMTMSDLGNYHYKRSYYDKDIDYVYVFHYPLSTHMVLHTGALRNYDTILCVGEFQFEEIRQTEKLYGIPAQRLIACGYGQLEKLYDQYQTMPKEPRDTPKVLIAPSWQPDNILDSCIDPLLTELLGKGFRVVVRPHPEYMKRYQPRMTEIVHRWENYEGGDLSFELDFTSNQSIFDSDTVITDWSGTAYEFAFVTERPCVFVDTPPKINNPEYDRITVEPLEFSLRGRVGIRENPDDLTGLAERIRTLLGDESRRDSIRKIREETIANFGRSGEVAGQYLIESIRRRIEKRRGADAQAGECSRPA